MADDKRPAATALQQRIGARASALVNAETIARANAQIEALRAQGETEIAAQIQLFCALVEAGPPYSARTLFKCLHDLRGIAGTFGAHRVGEAAHIACAYFDVLGNDGCADPDAVRIFAAMLTKADQSAEDAGWPALLNEARAAFSTLAERTPPASV